jgi:hypothetical protein
MSPLRAPLSPLSLRSRAADLYFGYRFYGFRYAG